MYFSNDTLVGKWHFAVDYTAAFYKCKSLLALAIDILISDWFLEHDREVYVSLTMWSFPSAE